MEHIACWQKSNIELFEWPFNVMVLRRHDMWKLEIIPLIRQLNFGDNLLELQTHVIRQSYQIPNIFNAHDK